MRMRAKKNREERLQKVEHMLCVVNEDVIDIDSSFNDKRPLWVELGCGKGAFATQMSARHPEVNYLAFEKVRDVMLMAMEKADREGCGNLKFYDGDAENICTLLGENKISALFINFCDPWSKKRYAKRRLTSPIFLEKYKKVLAENARIFFKTDNRELFDYSLETFTEAGFTLDNVCFDLHNSPMNETNIPTEYEKNFSAKGFTINYLEAFI
ncbi:MAG: tRNA (guanosine(46)-N7)-methyltransferase TrmB [Clostridia bacterium]|nr:tRNA (guanosine(46)-N7)-methyltransferase TrmB [Clostridia bacterium]